MCKYTHMCKYIYTYKYTHMCSVQGMESVYAHLYDIPLFTLNIYIHLWSIHDGGTIHVHYYMRCTPAHIFMCVYKYIPLQYTHVRDSVRVWGQCACGPMYTVCAQPHMRHASPLRDTYTYTIPEYTYYTLPTSGLYRARTMRTRL